MDKFFGFFWCVVAAALIVGVHSDCLSILMTISNDSKIGPVFSEAYFDAIGQLSEGSCSQQEAEAVAKTSVTDKGVLEAVLEVSAFILATIEGDPRCVGAVETKIETSASATAQACASAHASALVEALGGPYFPSSLASGEADSVAPSFQQVFAKVFSEVTQNICPPYQACIAVIKEFDEQAIVTAIAEAFAKAVATYTSPQGKSYCPL